MKKVILVLTVVLFTASSLAQAPASFKYQAVLRDTRGNTRANTAANLGIDLLQGSVTGVSVYRETHNVTTDGFGLINIEIGKGTASVGSLSAVDWSVGPYFIKVIVDGLEMGTSQLLSVPFALYAKTAGNGFSGRYSDLTSKPLLFDGTWSSLTGKPAFASVATSGSYNDLANKPVLFSGAWSSLTGKPTYSVVASSGNYNDLLNKPVLFNGTWTNLTGKPSTVAEYGITDAVKTTGDQTIAGKKTFTGTISASNKVVSNVATPVVASDAVNKAYVDALLEKIEQLKAESGVSDIDGNHYKSVKIGSQVWMAENLRATHYSDGSALTDGMGAGDISGNYTSKYFFAYNDDISKVTAYGQLYTWAAAMNGSLSSSNNPSGVQGICPTGWHLPSSEEWNTLITYLGGESVAGGKLKEAGLIHWDTPNSGADNSSGFTALAAGQRGNSSYVGIGKQSFMWLANEGNPSVAWYGYLLNTNSEGKVFGNVKSISCSVRCVKDGNTMLPTVSTTAISDITISSAAGGGNITFDGGVSITARGICWSTSANPTIDLSTKTIISPGIGSYTSSISGLAESTTYYVRAYGTNNAGTTYGDQVSFTTASALPTNGLVAYYPFNGNANDESTNANNGIVTGASLTTNRSGVANKAYYFDGVSNYIKITGALPITNSFTISFWTNCEGAGNYNNIICDGSSQSGGDDFLINFRGTSIGIRADKNNLPLNYEDNPPATLSNLDIINKWVHVVWVMDPASSKVYLNGGLIATINQAGTNEGYHDAFSFIGARQVWGTPDNFFKGKIDDILIYNRPLTGPEISILYNLTQ